MSAVLKDIPVADILYESDRPARGGKAILIPWRRALRASA
jgi:hypothetical protein